MLRTGLDDEWSYASSIRSTPTRSETPQGNLQIKTYSEPTQVGWLRRLRCIRVWVDREIGKLELYLR